MDILLRFERLLIHSIVHFMVRGTYPLPFTSVARVKMDIVVIVITIIITMIIILVLLRQKLSGVTYGKRILVFPE